MLCPYSQSRCHTHPFSLYSPSQIHLINGTLLTYLVPLPKSDKEASEPDAAATWTDRFLLVEQGLSSENQRQALMTLTRLSNKTGSGSMWEGYFGACEKYNVRSGWLCHLRAPSQTCS